ncbi:zinc-ribbon domain-containing protein [Candidatus Bathyarchaeota archaeon]|nr:MAG: zinc-ribbon domain-containing protein [Candidatus Bathyarchaeota archaeon]
MPYCTICGAKLKETDKYCSGCGSQVKPKQPNQIVRQVTNKIQIKTPPSHQEYAPPARPINRDSVIVTLNTREIRRGDKIEGEATLNLIKPQKKGLFVRLEIVAEHRELEFDAENERDTSFQRIYEYREFLDGEKEYSEGPHVYNFSITVPENLEEWRMKRESVIMKKLGRKPEQYLDKTMYDPRSLTWYMIVLFNKRQLGLAPNAQIPLTFIT